MSPNKFIVNNEVIINERDFRILKCSQPDGMGYMNDDRVIDFMNMGLIEFTEKKNWHIKGYKATKKGIKLFNNIMEKIREKHNHQWETYEDYCKREGYKNTSYTKEQKTKPYDSAYSIGYHNGYRCKVCGFCFCTSCHLENEIPKCSKKTKNKKMSSDENLNQEFVAMDNAIRSSFGLSRVKL